jgi:hypothetical protein
MRIFRNFASVVAMAAALLTSATGFADPPSGGQSTPGSGDPLSSDQLSQAYQSLSPAARAALADQIKAKGLDGLSSMSESDVRTAFAGLPSDTQAQIQAKWDALSDEQRIALKKMSPTAIKEILASQMKDALRQSTDRVAKPAQQVIEKAQSVAEKAKTMIERGRDYVQALIARLKGQPDQPDGQRP